jgi:tRNA threonylcarbamoyl adenosine modification protein (Sua5/YciO/YrdC/YwlC family)
MKIFDSIEDSEIIQLINDGHIGVLPTDTVYGIVCKASNKESVKLLYETKRRGQTKPGTIIAANENQLIELGFNKSDLSQSKRFLNLGISVIMGIDNSKSYLNFEVNTQAARIIKSGLLHQLLQKTGPLLTSSANNPGESPVKSIKEAVGVFGDRIKFYVDGGEMNISPSTILKINNNGFEIIRRGSIDVNELLKQNLS